MLHVICHMGTPHFQDFPSSFRGPFCSNCLALETDLVRFPTSNLQISQDGQYVLCWDPLDGSSIVDNNWAVGTIIGVWDKSTGLIGATGRDQVMSIVTLYGPRTTVFITLDDGVYEFTLGDGSWAGITIYPLVNIQKTMENHHF